MFAWVGESPKNLFLVQNLSLLVQAVILVKQQNLLGTWYDPQIILDS